MVPGGAEHNGSSAFAPIDPWVSWGAAGECLRYFKRYRMEVPLDVLPAPVLPPGFRFVPWHESLLEAHGEALCRSFAGGVDTQVFPSLGSRAGCLSLMTEICHKPAFIPEATWLLASDAGPCGTVQGMHDRSGMGAIQNIGIVATYRGHGLGRALLMQALHGFRRTGHGRAMLEVTAENDAAVRLYRRLGFVRRKTLYKAVAVTNEPWAAVPVRAE